MLRVALTGGIATGKSYVLARFAQRGVPTIDADVVARGVVRRGEPAWAAVRARFGDAILLADGELDRPNLAAIVFADPVARRDLEAIIHPAVYASIAAWSARLAATPRIAIADIPLLYETDHEREFERVIVTWCPAAMQIERMMKRNGVALEDARLRLAAQWPIDEKARRADYVIKTDRTFDDTDRQVEETYGDLLVNAET